MKKIKWSIMSLAVIFSICAAFATKPKFDCTGAQQYFYTGNSYFTVSSTWGCMQGSSTCSYYLTGGVYTPCTVGVYNSCYSCAVEDQKTNTKTKPAVTDAGSELPNH